MRNDMTRRTFVRTLAVGGAAAVVMPAWARGEPKGPNDRITLGFIGVGTMGRGHLKSSLGDADIQVVAVCDVVKERRESAKKMVEDAYAKARDKENYKGCAVFNDFRELLDRKDIDAVLIATPDHWHALPAVYAARAKKDIYCEKPLTRTIAEGRRVVEEAKKNNVIFQTGSQQRSEFGGHFRTAVELVRNGRIGKVKTVWIGVGAPNKPCDLKEEEVPEGTDWDRWLGPAPKRGYSSVLCPKGVHNHFPAWRNYREYAGGLLADMGAHHFDIAQWALGMDGGGPVSIEPPEGKAETGLRYVYASGVEMFHGVEPHLPKGLPTDCVFHGSDGTIFVSREEIIVAPGRLAKAPLPEGGFRAYPSNNQRRNWIECVRSRKEPICPAEVGHRSATVCHLGNIGYQLRKKLKWDPAAERFDDDEANKLIDQPMREPWKF
jgi:predicted dehydrogenase